MDDTGIFRKAMADHGGRLDTASLTPTTAERLNYAAERARGFLQTAVAALPAMPPIYFDFIDNWKFDAVAFRQDGRYFIGVHRGRSPPSRHSSIGCSPTPESCPLSGMRKKRWQICL